MSQANRPQPPVRTSPHRDTQESDEPELEESDSQNQPESEYGIYYPMTHRAIQHADPSEQNFTQFTERATRVVELTRTTSPIRYDFPSSTTLVLPSPTTPSLGYLTLPVGIVLVWQGFVTIVWLVCFPNAIATPPLFTSVLVLTVTSFAFDLDFFSLVSDPRVGASKTCLDSLRDLDTANQPLVTSRRYSTQSTTDLSGSSVWNAGGGTGFGLRRLPLNGAHDKNPD
ncbi:hypothetical protein K435DRAFT_878994 [Dendrothele bispora CBS 962.96]|uniref:Uncharacterized protein n=1 Tax=Dendrothele bispora (strain CBS 962.96) TaxID=1314807 RepID=A0A4V4HAS2_DENBC|nr:hypothetical protein K435DRAFT_878994 [Dendrothele bispora CBS 962.96]